MISKRELTFNIIYKESKGEDNGQRHKQSHFGGKSWK
jgi:hypothetical protein